jgi:hypothetical protein
MFDLHVMAHLARLRGCRSEDPKRQARRKNKCLFHG